MAPSYASTGHASHSKDTPDAINLSTLFAAHKITPLTEEDCIFDFPVVDLWKAYFLDGCGYGYDLSYFIQPLINSKLTVDCIVFLVN